MGIAAINKVIKVFENSEELYNDILFKYVNLSSTKRQLIAYNHAQLQKGIKRDGTIITPFYASIFYKGRISPVDLKRTGAFYRSFTVSVAKNKNVYIFLSATDPKTPKLEFKYSTKIFGLSKGSIKLFIDNFKPYFISEIKKEILNRI